MTPKLFIKEYGEDKAKQIIAEHQDCVSPKSFRYWSIEHNDFSLIRSDSGVNVEDLKKYLQQKG